MTGATDAYTVFETALAGLLTAIREDPALEDAWAAVDRLSEQVEGPLRSEVKMLRSQTAQRIKQERRLSLAGLGKVIGTSRGRAGQLLDIANGKAGSQ